MPITNQHGDNEGNEDKKLSYLRCLFVEKFGGPAGSGLRRRLIATAGDESESEYEHNNDYNPEP